MQIKLRNKFYVKIFLCFWLFGAAILITISFLAGQIKLQSWVSPREKVFINSYAVAIINGIDEVANRKSYLCRLNKKLENTFYLVSPSGNIACQSQPQNLNTIIKKNNNQAYVFENYLVSDAIYTDGSKYWLLSIRDKPLYNKFLKKYVGYRFVLAIFISILICFFIAKYLTSPLKTVVEKMAQFANGNLNARVGKLLKKRNDEFTEIGSEFDKMADSIKEMIHNKQQMLYNISHELRSPLARQLLSLDLLKISPNKDQLELINEIKKENLLLNELIGEILMLAKLSTKNFSYNPSKQNVSAIIKNCVKNINFEFQTSIIKFQGKKDLYAILDKKLINILIENLLKNAIKYSGTKNTINISTKEDNKSLYIKISDQGPGVAAEDLSTIFEPFKQSANKNKIKANDNGYGLGLAIAKEIVMLHNGKITAENAVPSGLTITIIISAE